MTMLLIYLAQIDFEFIIIRLIDLFVFAIIIRIVLFDFDLDFYYLYFDLDFICRIFVIRRIGFDFVGVIFD